MKADSYYRYYINKYPSRHKISMKVKPFRSIHCNVKHETVANTTFT